MQVKAKLLAVVINLIHICIQNYEDYTHHNYTTLNMTTVVKSHIKRYLVLTRLVEQGYI